MTSESDINLSYQHWETLFRKKAVASREANWGKIEPPEFSPEIAATIIAHSLFLKCLPGPIEPDSIFQWETSTALSVALAQLAMGEQLKKYRNIGLMVKTRCFFSNFAFDF